METIYVSLDTDQIVDVPETGWSFTAINKLFGIFRTLVVRVYQRYVECDKTDFDVTKFCRKK